MVFENYKKKFDLGDAMYVLLRAVLVSLLLSVIIMMMFGYKFMIVVSGSMTPSIPVGSLVIVQPCDYDDLREGDVVTMQKGGYYLTHRVYRWAVGKDAGGNYIWAYEGDADYMVNGYWVTKGDASDTLDGRLQEHQVVGTVLWCCEAVGYVYRFIDNNRIYTAVLIGLFAIEMMVASYITDMFKVVDIEEDADEDDEDVEE